MVGTLDGEKLSISSASIGTHTWPGKTEQDTFIYLATDIVETLTKGTKNTL